MGIYYMLATVPRTGTTEVVLTEWAEENKQRNTQFIESNDYTKGNKQVMWQRGTEVQVKLYFRMGV